MSQTSSEQATGLLAGLSVLDFSQFLSGPYCSLRLLDLGASVLKVENPDGGDLTRRLYLSGAKIGEDSTLFHAINRGKDTIVIDLKSAAGQAAAQRLAGEADVVIQNFRPGVAERLGLGYKNLSAINPTLIYGSVSGYGPDGPWANLPGQDLLAQARSGVMWLSGNEDAGPVPIGLPVADIMAGAHLAHGILAALFRRERLGVGALIETSLLEAIVDLQFEFLTTYLNNGEKKPKRLKVGSAHGYQPAPYGIFATSDGHIALAMGKLDRLAELLNLTELLQTAALDDSEAGFIYRDKINNALRQALQDCQSEQVENTFTANGIWCAKVLSWDDLLASDSFKALGILQTETQSGATLLRSPLRIDGSRAEAKAIAPAFKPG